MDPDNRRRVRTGRKTLAWSATGARFSADLSMPAQPRTHPPLEELICLDFGDGIASPSRTPVGLVSANAFWLARIPGDRLPLQGLCGPPRDAGGLVILTRGGGPAGPAGAEVRVSLGLGLLQRPALPADFGERGSRGPVQAARGGSAAALHRSGCGAGTS